MSEMPELKCQRCGDPILEGQLRISHLGLAEYSKSSKRNVYLLDEKCYRSYFRMVNYWLVEGMIENLLGEQLEKVKEVKPDE